MVKLRPLEEKDQLPMLDILTDASTKQTYMLPDFESREAAISLFRRLLEMSNGKDKYVRAITLENHLIGFLNQVEIQDASMELGYVIHPAFRSKGYMTEALKLAIRELFTMGWREVITGAFSGNTASIRVMEKCGMHRTHKTEPIEYRGKIHTCIYYAIQKQPLRYPCLVLDHDDTVVQSEATVNYPCFCRFLEQYRPGASYSLAEYMNDCSKMPFTELCRSRFSMNDAELKLEYQFWKDYAQAHIPDPFPGIRALLQRYRAAGGNICVVSMSSHESILRDYRTHFGLEPDLIFSWDLPEDKRKPSPWSLEQIRKHFGFSPEEMLVVDDMKFAVGMAREVGCPIAFAAWRRQDFPEISREMETLCDFTFHSTEELENFLFDSLDKHGIIP